MGPEGGTWRPDSARMTRTSDALADRPRVRSGPSVDGLRGNEVDVSDVNCGRPRGITADRPPYRGGLSATTIISGLS